MKIDELINALQEARESIGEDCAVAYQYHGRGREIHDLLIVEASCGSTIVTVVNQDDEIYTKATS